MDESLLHYVWKLQHFDHRDGRCQDGTMLRVDHPGTFSRDAGPDFLGSRVCIDGIDWTGNVEIHVDSRDWYAHGHHEDPAYNNVVLHVVWHQKGKVARRADGSEIPVLELKNRVDAAVLLRYKKLASTPNDIPCEEQLPAVPEIVKLSMIDQAMTARLERKAEEVLHLLERANNDWEETTYRLMASNFGFKTNREPFSRLARGVPRSVLLKHADHVQQVESILFGTGGFLEGRPVDGYHGQLQQMYRLYERKYGLGEVALKKHNWKFARMRPAGFPTVRIAQFAAFIASVPNLFSALTDPGTPDEMRALFSFPRSEYWEQHYDFGKRAGRKMPGLGTEAQRNIMINTLVPVLFAYGLHVDSDLHTQKAVALLSSVRPENNRIIRRWKSLGMQANSATESQGLIELYNEYCARKRCTMCKIGNELLSVG